MKCPEWLLEAMRKGEGVKCWVWDSIETNKNTEIVNGFNTVGDLFFFSEEKGEWFAHAEPYSEPAHEFKPFEQVLVRNETSTEWRCKFFSHMRGELFYCVGSFWNYCIPYAGNESLLGTTDSPKGGN